MKKSFLAFVAASAMTLSVMAETTPNPIITAMPSLQIAPDARAGGMADLGVSTSADLNSQHWNAAKYAFMESHGGITANYTPWLRKLVKDIDLAYIAGYYKWDDLQGISASFRYFSLGDVQLTNIDGTFLQDAHPNEWAIDVAYSRKLHDFVSMAVALRFMYSDMNNGAGSNSMLGGQELKAGWTMAADISLFYRQPLEIKTGTSYLQVGLNISNLGGKISYDSGTTKQFIPANVRLGITYDLPFDKYNRLSFTAEMNKLMVPASQRSKFYNADEDGTYAQWYSSVSSMKGLFQSFADAPGGFKEELKEIQWGLGLEYTYDHKFFARTGYSHESKMKGNRRYFTFGAGFHLSIFSFDVAYVLATHATNPLDQTLRFTVGFDLAGIKDLVKN
ncbi:MAG: type IX secretion system outer membrane channel protein PorV [Paludibacteraceae bacterium]|nr:type IX secretion system outer membrane channel protein PorV [Paludibacteraceae bacterium]